MVTLASILDKLSKRGIAPTLIDGTLTCNAGSGTHLSAPILSAKECDLAMALYLKASGSRTPPPLVRSNEPPTPSLTQTMWWQWVDEKASLFRSIVEPFRGMERAALVSALRILIDKHEVLRSHFVELDGQLTVEFQSGETFQIEEELLPPASTFSDLMRSVNTFLQRPLTIREEWPIRAKVISSSRWRHVVVLALNQLVVDVPSILLLQAQLSTLVRGTLSGRLLERLPRYRDYSAWQRRWELDAGVDRRRYWRHWCEHQAPIMSPSAGRTLHWMRGSKNRLQFGIPPWLHGAAMTKAQDTDTSAFIIYLTIYSIALAKWLGRQSFAVRCIADGRVLPELASVVGQMAAADTVGITVNPSNSFHEAIESVSREYDNATKLRGPAIYAFPPFTLDGKGCEESDQSLNVPLVFNYQRMSKPRLAVPAAPLEWPPKIQLRSEKEWGHAVSPILLKLTNYGETATGSLAMHSGLLTETEQGNLAAAFFETLSECFITK